MTTASRSILAIVALTACAGSAFAGTVGGINSLFEIPRLFNDRPDSILTVTNNYPASYQIREEGFGPGGFANRHSAYFSDDSGATPYDFNYDDAFDIAVTVNRNTQQAVSMEAGIHSDLFGLGFFGQLPNGEVVSFGSVFPFHSFGVQPLGASIDLRIVHTPGSGDGISSLPMGGTFSTVEYQYNLGGGWVSSGPINWTTGEGGIPSAFNFYIGVGTQNNGAAEENAIADVTFSNFSVTVPAPGAAALTGLVAIAGLRRRRA